MSRTRSSDHRNLELDFPIVSILSSATGRILGSI